MVILILIIIIGTYYYFNITHLNYELLKFNNIINRADDEKIIQIRKMRTEQNMIYYYIGENIEFIY